MSGRFVNSASLVVELLILLRSFSGRFGVRRRWLCEPACPSPYASASFSPSSSSLAADYDGSGCVVGGCVSRRALRPLLPLIFLLLHRRAKKKEKNKRKQTAKGTPAQTATDEALRTVIVSGERRRRRKRSGRRWRRARRLTLPPTTHPEPSTEISDEQSGVGEIHYRLRRTKCIPPNTCSRCLTR